MKIKLLLLRLLDDKNIPLMFEIVCKILDGFRGFCAKSGQIWESKR